MGNAHSTPYVPDASFVSKQFCNRCMSMFGTVEGLRALVSKKGYRYHSPAAIMAGMVNGCPLCNEVLRTWYEWSKVDDEYVDIKLDEEYANKVCIVRAICRDEPPPNVSSTVAGYPLRILSMGFVCTNVAFGEAFLTMYQLPGPPHSEYLLGSSTRSYPMSGERNLQEVKRRLKVCLSNHERCPNKMSSPLPTTVLDLDPEKPKLYASALNESGRYIALSYCWGGPQTMTTKATLEAHMAGIELGTLSQTIQDAILVTRKLGIRFLWVDALCIIQDDERLRNIELDRMGKIYANAVLTISASSSTSAAEGFLRTPEAPNGGCELPFLLPNGKFARVLAVSSKENKLVGFRKPLHVREFPMTYSDWLEQEIMAWDMAGSRPFRSKQSQYPETQSWPLDSRAWVLQEHMLSAHLLVFGPDDVRFRCAQTPLEPLYLNPIPYRGAATKLPIVPDPSLAPAAWHWHLPRGLASVGSTTTKQRQLWTTVIVDFSSRFITIQHDRLSALAGIASQLQLIWGGKYVAGYWVECLLPLLCWVKDPNFKHHAMSSGETEEYLAPTWSWISAKQPVKLMIIEEDAELVSVSAEPLDPEARFGRVKSGTLTLRAPVRSEDPMALLQWDEKRDDGQKLNEGMVLVKIGRYLYVDKHVKAFAGLVLQLLDDQKFRRVGTFVTRNVDLWAKASASSASKSNVTII